MGLSARACSSPRQPVTRLTSSRTIAAGLLELGLGRAWARGKTVLLKPNLVEPSREAPEINTHPYVVRAAAEVFRSWGRREVFVAEGPGHCRDALLVLDQSGLGEILDESRPGIRRLESRRGGVRSESFAADDAIAAGTAGILKRADLIVSLAQAEDAPLGGGHALAQEPLRRHARDRVRVAQERAALRRHRSSRSSTSPRPSARTWRSSTGSSAWKETGRSWARRGDRACWSMGTNLPAVDATCARLMRIDPCRVGYLAAASSRLGPIAERHISQRGEAIAELAQPFQLVDQPWLAGLRA